MHNYAFHPVTLLLYIFIFDTIDEIIGLIISRLEQTWLITSLNSTQHLLLVIIAFLTLDKLAANLRHTTIIITLATERCDKLLALGQHAC